MAAFKGALRQLREAGLTIPEDVMVSHLFERAKVRYPVWYDVELAGWTTEVTYKIETLRSEILSIAVGGDIAVALRLGPKQRHG